MINVAVQEGWAGGPWMTKEFKQALKSAGFNVSDPQHSEVMFAHSTACYDLPLKSPISFYFLIDPPYWPGKSIFSRLLANKRADSNAVKHSRGRKYRLMKTVWGSIYILQKPRYTFLALQNNRRLDFLSSLKGKQVVIIRNEQDKSCSPDIQVALASYPFVRYAVVPGGHDDYMTNPQPYIDLLYKAI
jgi:hypothetical protein